MVKTLAGRSSKPTKPEPQSICEQALRFLKQQHLEPIPAHYELAYAAFASSGSALLRAMDAITMDGSLLTEAQAADLSKRFLTSEEHTGTDSANETIRHQTLRIADLAADAVAATGEFNRDLSAELKAFPQDGGRVVERIEAMVRSSDRAEKELSAAAREVEALREQLDAARSDADRDALTGIANRRGAERRVAELKGPAVVALCDVDRFKLLNDQFGHAVGDRVLKLVAETLEAACAPHFVGRWGGEEFLILIEGASIEQATGLIDDARREMEQRRIRVRETDQPLGPVTFSAGVASCTPKSFRAAFQDSDRRLYAAKAAGRNRVAASD